MDNAQDDYSPSKPDVDTTTKKTHVIWFLHWIATRIKHGWPLIIAFVGAMGSGKSYSAISLAQAIDPNFTAANIVFTVKDFARLITARLPRGSVIIFDDAGVDANSRDWHSKRVKLLARVAQSFRIFGIIVIITTPKMEYIDSQTRKLLTVLFEAPTPKIDSDAEMSRKGIMKVFRVIPPAFRNMDGNWYRRFRIVRYRNYRKIIIEENIIKFRHPFRFVTRVYEQNKEVWLRDVYISETKAVEELDQLERNINNGGQILGDAPVTPENKPLEQTAKANETKTDAEVVLQKEFGVKLYCTKCHFVYKYDKPSWDKAKCPRCGEKTKIPEMLKPYVGVYHPPINYVYDE